MLLVAGGLVYDHDGNTDRPMQSDILIDAGRIVAVGGTWLRGCLAFRCSTPVTGLCCQGSSTLTTTRMTRC